MSSSTARNRFRRPQQNNEEPDSSSYSWAETEYYGDEDRQELLPSPPSWRGNNAVNYVVKRFGWWLLVMLFPYIFGPMIALREVYSRSKRTYMAARYAHEAGYISYLWPYLLAELINLVTMVIWICTVGKCDLTNFFERRVPNRRYNFRRRTRDTDSNNQDSVQRRYSSQQHPLNNERDIGRPVSYGVFASIKLIWRLLKMCIGVLLLGLYVAIKWPRRIVSIILLIIFLKMYMKSHEEVIREIEFMKLFLSTTSVP